MAKEKEVIGPDSRFSWIMVIGCFIVNSVTYGMIRSQGVYYLSVINNFSVTRAEASWPFSICVALTSLNGPLSGALCQKYGSRICIVVGSILATLGMALAFFAETIPELIGYIGIIHGFGLGLCMTPVPITINQYFVKHRASAQGVAFSGSTLMSFALPAILTWFTDEYGLRGAFLLGGGFVLNGAIGGVIIQTPPWLRKKPDRTQTNIVAAAVLASERASNVVGPSSPSPSKKLSSIAWESSRPSDPVPIEVQEAESVNSLVNQELEAEEAKYGAHYKSVECIDDVFDAKDHRQSMRRGQNRANPTIGMDSQSIRRISSSSAPVQPSSELFRANAASNKKLESRVKKVTMAIVGKFGGACGTIFGIVKHPMFVIICLSWASFMLVFLTYNLVITDYAVDQGISVSDSVMLYTAFSGGDLFGRLGLGWVTDKGFLKRRTYIALALSSMGVLILVQPLLNDNFALFLTTAAMLGTIVGSTLVLFFVLYSEYMKPEQLPLAIGLNTAFNGAIMFARPVLLGFFRDSLGSYSYLFYTCGGAQIGIASLWLLEPLIMRRMAAKKPTVEIATIS